MSLGDTANINIAEDFRGATTPLIPPEAFENGFGVELPPRQDNPFAHDEVLGIQQCVDGRFFGYGVQLGFETPEDLQAFRDHPQRTEIEATIKEYIASENEETLFLEMERDDGGAYSHADHESFNSGTLGDFQVSVDEIIPQINQAYGLNIQGGQVLQESVEVPALPGMCSEAEPLPDNVAGLLPVAGMKLGGTG